MRTSSVSSRSLASESDALLRLLVHPEMVPVSLGSEVGCGERDTLTAFFCRLGGPTETGQIRTCFNKLTNTLVDAPPGRSGSVGIRSVLLSHFASALAGTLSCAPSGAEFLQLREMTAALVGEVLIRALREHIETTCGRMRVATQSELIGWYGAKLWSPRGPTSWHAFVHLCRTASVMGQPCEVSALVRSLGDWKPWLGKDRSARAAWAVIEAIQGQMASLPTSHDGRVADTCDRSLGEKPPFLAAAELYLVAVESFPIDREGGLLDNLLASGRRLEAKCMSALCALTSTDAPERLRTVRRWMARLEFYREASDLVRRWEGDAASEPPRLRWSNIGEAGWSGVFSPPTGERERAELVDAETEALSVVARLDPRLNPFPVLALEKAASAFLALREAESEAVIQSLLSDH